MKTLAECQTFPNTEAFYLDDEKRRFSPEWDYGVHWGDGVQPFPRWRVSWVVETGDLYAHSLKGVILLGNVPRVGEYPVGAPDSWALFKDAQTVEEVLEGWAEQPTMELAWVLERLQSASA